jgi:hypothetical protein
MACARSESALAWVTNGAQAVGCGLSTLRIVQIGHAGLNGVVEAFQA